MRYQKEIKFKLSQVNAVYFKVWETTLSSRFGYAVHWWKSPVLRINGLVNRRTLNYTKVDYRKLILRFHSQRKGRAPGCWLPGGWSQRKQLPWPWPQPPNSVCHCQWCFHSSHPPWPPHSITVTALLKGHSWVLILSVKLILRDQRMLFPGPEELSGKIFIKGTSLNF